MFTIIGADGREYGPVTADQVRAWIKSGRADEDTKAKATGSDEWMRLGDFPEFSGDEPPVIAPEHAETAPDIDPLATRTSRLGAALLDMALGATAALPGGLLLGKDLVLKLLRQEWPDDFNVGRVASGLVVLGMGLFLVFIVQTWLLIARGQTIGKRVAGIRIVRNRTGAAPGFVHAVLLRSWLANLIGVIPSVGSVFQLLDLAFIFRPERRCLHDLIADTKVVAGQPPRD
jgi:uncharacterized RDD family membrane protein YckC